MSRKRYYRKPADADRYEIKIPDRQDVKIRAIAAREGTTPASVVVRLLDVALEREAGGTS